MNEKEKKPPIKRIIIIPKVWLFLDYRVNFEKNGLPN